MDDVYKYNYKSIKVNTNKNTYPYNFIHLLYSLLVQNNKTFTDILYITHVDEYISYKCSYDDFVTFLLQQSDYYDLIDRDIIIHGDNWKIEYDILNLWRFTFIPEQFIIVE